MHKNWNAGYHQQFLSAAILTGTPLSYIRDHLVELETGLPILSQEDYINVKNIQWRSTSRSLNRFRAEQSTVKLPTHRNCHYKIVPESFRFSKIVNIAKNSKEKLPVFTQEHYKSQFLKTNELSTPSDESKTAETTIMSTRTPTQSSNMRKGKSKKTPPRNIVTSTDIDDTASRLSGMGLSVRAQKNAKFEEVDPDSDRYHDVLELAEGIDNPGDIYVRLLNQVHTMDDFYWMQALQVIIPVYGPLLNSKVSKTKFKLVLTNDGRKAVEMASPMSYERQVEDARVIEFDNHEQFGKHDERYVAHTSTLAIKITETPKDGNVRYTLLLLPMDLESPLEDDDDDCVLFGNSDFNLLKGKIPSMDTLQVPYHFNSLSMLITTSKWEGLSFLLLR